MAEISKSLGERLGKIISTQKQWSAAPFDEKRIELTGKRAVVQKGGSVIIRILPGPPGNRENIYAEAKQHWVPSPRVSFDVPCYCLRSIDENEQCPICEALAKLQRSGSDKIRELVREARARDVFLWNVCLGSLKQRTANPQCGFVVLTDNLSAKIASIMTGEGEDEFAYGDITDPKEGYDLKFTRPGADGQRWQIEVAKKPTPLFLDVDKPPKQWPAPWKDWETKFILNLDEVVASYVNVAREEARKHAEYLLTLAGSGGVPTPAEEDEEVFSDSGDQDEVEIVEEDAQEESPGSPDEEVFDDDDDDLPF